jgi:hypothetical protein
MTTLDDDKVAKGVFRRNKNHAISEIAPFTQVMQLSRSDFLEIGLPNPL